MFQRMGDRFRRGSKLLLICLFVYVPVTYCNDAHSICQSRFLRYTRSHTACVPPNPTCKILSRGLEINAQQIILNVHNQYRAQIASGNESRLGFPGASNMLKLEWDPELAYVAQAHADQCKFEHDCYDCRRTGKYKVVGQNLYVYQTSRTGPAVKQDWPAIIKEWYDEIKIAPPSVARSFNLHELNIGHFTQMAWASTNKVGCGAVTYDITNEPAEGGYGPSPFKTAVLYTCNYAPGGNFLGEKMYRNGSPASQCPKKHRPSSVWPTLCEFSSSTTTSVTQTSSHVNVSTTQQITTSHRTTTNNGNINNQVTNIVRKKIVTTRKKTKKITKKIKNNLGGNRFTTSTTTSTTSTSHNGAQPTTITTTTTATDPVGLPTNTARPKILVNLSTPKPTIFNWTTSPPISIVQPPIIVPTAKPVLHIPNIEQQPPTISYNNDIVTKPAPTKPLFSEYIPSFVDTVPTLQTLPTIQPVPSTPTPPPIFTTQKPNIFVDDNNHITEVIPKNNHPPVTTTRSPVTIRPLNSGGTQLVAAVAPWWKKWIVNTPTTRKPGRSRLLVTSSINRIPFTNSINKWPGSVINNNNHNNKPSYSPISSNKPSPFLTPNNNKPAQSHSWNNLFASSSNQIPRLANTHWSSQNLYFLTHNFTNNGFAKPISLTPLTTFNNNAIGNGENYRYSHFTIGRA